MVLPVDRRAVLKGAGAFSLLSAAPAFAGAGPSFSCLCALKDENGYGVAALSARGEVLKRRRLPDRAHGAALSPDKKTAVIFARRPGRYFAVWNLAQDLPLALHPCRSDRLFYGHGFFSADGNLLYATENDFDGETGVLGVYDARRGFARMGEMPTGGIGPHEAILLRGGKTAAIANGGIATHPDYPREKLNLVDMEPNLAFLDLHSGAMTSVQSLPSALHQVSLRHLAEDGGGSVWIGGQYEGPLGDDIPLLFIANLRDKIQPVDAPAGVYRNMRQYIGSVAANPKAGIVASTSPRRRCLACVGQCAPCLTCRTIGAGCLRCRPGRGRGSWPSMGAVMCMMAIVRSLPTIARPGTITFFRSETQLLRTTRIRKKTQ